MFIENLFIQRDDLSSQYLCGIATKSLLGAALLVLLGFSTRSMAEMPNPRIQQGQSSSYQEHFLKQQKSGRISGNNSIIYQQGAGNDAIVNQNLQGSGLANLAIIDQFGSDNEGVIIQQGSDNIGLLMQQGTSLSHEMVQRGQHFSAEVLQNGHNASLQLSQSGSGLRAIQVRQWAPSGAGARVTIDTR